MGEWRKHDGGDCPVKDGENFEFLYRGGRKVKVTNHNGSQYRWSHIGASHDIVAYRLLDNQTEALSPP